jgi:hypothetical protein
MPQLRIEKPCHESWRKMAKKDDGRFCLSCQKTVVDFTSKSEKEILEFLKTKNGEEVCGRCRTNHVSKPVSRYSWLAAILAFAFLLSSCWRRTQGCVAYYDSPKQGKHHKELKSDSVKSSRFGPDARK